MMQTVIWKGPIIGSALSRSFLHFFPSSGNVTAPYNTVCRLTLFGAGIEQKIVNLEGARLSQPDGVKLDEVFPALREGIKGFAGLEVELSGGHARVDLAGSSCVFEYLTGNQSVRFWPRQYVLSSLAATAGGAGRRGSGAPSKVAEVSAQEREASVVRRFPLLKDSFTTSSVVILNPSDCAATISLRDGVRGGVVATERIEARAVLEVPIPEKVFAEFGSVREMNWGLLRTAVGAGEIKVEDKVPLPTPQEPKPLAAEVRTPHAVSEEVGWYLLFRDPVTRRPTAIREVH